VDILAETSTTWIKEIPGDLFKLDETPLLGYPPIFPWIDFTKLIENSLQIEGLSLAPAEWRWRSKEELLDGLGDNLKSTSLTVVPLAGSVFWVMPLQEISKLMGHLLTGQNVQTFKNIDVEFQEAFYRFLILEAVNSFEKVYSDKQLSVTLSQKEDLPSSHYLCQDVTISLKDLTAHGRLFLSPEFRTSWMQRYLQEQDNNAYSSPLADKLSVIVQLEAGKVSLTPSEWKSIHVGDLVLLDTCTLEPDEDKGRIQLVINGISFFRGKIKDGNIKILEHPLYHEADTAMTNPPENPSNDEEIFDDSELDAEINSEIENDTADHSMQEADSDYEIESEIESEFNSNIDSDLESGSEFLESDLDHDFDVEKKTSNEKASKISGEKPSAQPPPTKAALTSPPASLSTKSSTMALEEIPLNIVVEVGRLQMSIKKLLELQPGNMLDLNIHPEAGVDLVLNGKRIAKGELLRIGDTLGVRIIDL
jgi:flagellar motor switch protein FliN/FliY